MKVRVVLATAALGAVALLGLTACGQAGTADALSPAASALSAVGFSPDDVTTVADTAPAADPSPSASADPTKKHPGARALRLRRGLARNVEHGEVVVQTKDGEKTVDVQRGTVTAITDTSVTVKSADGFTQTWVFGTPFHVIEHRTTIQATAVAVGAKVGVAGAKNGSTVTANLLVIAAAK